MRVHSMILGSASLLVLAAAAPALAQAAAAPSGTATADTQTSPAGGTPASAQDAAGAGAQAPSGNTAADGEIVVTGIRASLRSAQNIKRNSAQQIDAVVAEDIGKLPDVAVSDVAARIPGVQVERGGGEASRVLVRGLPNFTTTYDGREIFTAEARSVALQDFPAGGIAAVEVFKTTTADLVEGGLAGEINVRSRKPFDFDGLEIAGSLWGQYEKRSQHKDPNGNLLISDRWDTGIGEIGALVNFSYTRLRYLDSTRSNTDFIANKGLDPNGLNPTNETPPGSITTYHFPDIQRIDYGSGDRQRPSINGALQWKPTDNLEIYGEALWQGFRNKVSDRELSVPLWGGSSYTNLVFDPDTKLVESGQVNGTNPNARPEGFQGATYSKTDTYQYAGGFKYGAGPLKLSGDIAHTTSRFLDSVYSMDMAYAAAPQTITFNTGLDGLKAGPAFQYVNGPDPKDAATYVYRGFFDRQLIAKGRDWQYRLDATYDTGIDFLSKIEAGVRYVDRRAHFEDGSRYRNREGDRLPFSAIPVDYDVFHSGFPSGDPSGVRGYLAPTYSSIRDNIDDIRTLSGFDAGPPPADPSVTYSSRERSYAAYLELKYGFGSQTGFHVDGEFGLRAVKTKFSIDGTDRVHHPDPDGPDEPLPTPPDTFTPDVRSQEYTDWLPNVSARLHLTDQVQLRLSYTQTRTRPDFGSFNPGLALDPPPTDGTIRTANGGNPDLTPLNSNNYDASLEYYFTRNGFASAAVFRRNLRGFVETFQQVVDDPTYGPLRVNRPYNLDTARIQGAEAQVQTFLDADFVPTFLHSFGVQANVTYIDFKTGFPTGFADAGGNVPPQTPLVFISKWAYNLDGFYEHAGLSARLSYNYRTSWTPGTPQVRDGTTASGNYNLYSEKTRGVGRLDFSMSYDLFKNLTLTADWTNMLAKPYKTDLTYDYYLAGKLDHSSTFPRAIRYEESVFSAGVRFRF